MVKKFLKLSLNKDLKTDGIGVDINIGIPFFYEECPVNEAFKFSLTLSRIRNRPSKVDWEISQVNKRLIFFP